jgi:hypothetical protein
MVAMSDFRAGGFSFGANDRSVIYPSPYESRARRRVWGVRDKTWGPRGSVPKFAVFVPQRCLRMKDIYEILRQKELDVSRLQREVEALRVAAPLLLPDREAEDHNQPTLPDSAAPQPIDMQVANNPQQAQASGWGRAKLWLGR